MDPGLYQEAGPTDSSLPPGWPVNAKGWDDAPSARTQSGNCVQYTVMRHLLGPRRQGGFLATDVPRVYCSYKGKCLWSIDIFQPGIRKTYVYKQDFFVLVVICGGVRTETAVPPVPAGTWQAVSYEFDLSTVKHIEDFLFKETPCPYTYWGLAGVPPEVVRRGDEAASSNNTERGRGDFPGPPPKPEPEGIRPISPDEMERKKAEAKWREKERREIAGPMGGGEGPEHGHPLGSGEPIDPDPEPLRPVPEGAPLLD